LANRAHEGLRRQRSGVRMQASMTQRTGVSERRKGARKRPLSLVYVELSGANGGMLRDLSVLGFAVRAMMPLRVGEIAAFTFMLDTTTRVEGQCKVLWVEEDGRLAGMQFTEVEANQRELLRAWLGEKEVYEAPPEAPAPAGGKPPLAETMEELLEELRTVVPRPETSRRDELPLPELHGGSASDRETKTRESVEAAETVLAILRDAGVEKAGSESKTGEAQTEKAEVPLAEPHRMEPLPVLEETEFTREANAAKPWENRDVVWLAIRMMIAFALIAAAIVYHRPVGRAVIWLGEKIAGEEAPKISPASKSEIQPSEPEASPNSGPANPVSSADGDAVSAPVSDAETAKVSQEPARNTDHKTVDQPRKIEETSRAGTKSALPPAPVPLPATSKTTTFLPLVTPSADGGEQEYLAAQDILKNQNGGTRIGEAVRLLWVAVEKGNAWAEVALAELYWRGHGVAKNCDQTRILLTAAAKKGNEEGRKNLDQFLGEGCE
jgi:PilZ domain